MMAGLAAAGLAETTLVVVSADHGEELAERGLFGHKTLYEEVWRVPLLIRHPDLATGTRTTVPYANVDLLPTLAGIAGIEPPDGLDGMDVRHPSRPERATLGVAMTNKARRMAALRRGSEKLLLRCPGGGRTGTVVELYDLEADPEERVDLSSRSPETIESLFALMKLRLGGHPCPLIDSAVRGVAATEGLSEETVRELEALGYLG